MATATRSKKVKPTKKNGAKKAAKKTLKPRVERKGDKQKATKPKKEAKHDPDATKLLKLIESKEEVCQEKQIAYLRLKTQTKEAKEAYESSVADLRSEVRASKNDAQRPLFNQPKVKRKKGDKPKADDAPPKAAADPNAWREVHVDKLALGTQITNALIEAKLITIGNIADFTAGGKQLTDVEGIGPAKFEKIEKALEIFWQENPQAVKTEAEQAADSTATSLGDVPAAAEAKPESVDN